MHTQSKQIRHGAYFYGIAIGLALLVALSAPVTGKASAPLTMLTPAASVAIMLTLVAPEGSFREALRGLGMTSAGLKAWPLAAGLPLLIHLSSLLILAAAGLAVVVVPQVSGSVVQMAVHIVLGFIISTAFAFGEEVGWRGYLLPRLLGIGVMPAMLLVGFLHGLWHLPVMLGTDFYHSAGNPIIVVPMFLATLTLAGVFFGFLRLWTASVWPVAIAHSATNNAWELATGMTRPESPEILEYVGGESGVIMIAALLLLTLVIATRMARGSLRLPSSR